MRARSSVRLSKEIICLRENNNNNNWASCSKIRRHPSSILRAGKREQHGSTLCVVTPSNRTIAGWPGVASKNHINLHFHQTVLVVMVATKSGSCPVCVCVFGAWPLREGVGTATEKAKHQTLERVWDEERERVSNTVIINQTKRSFKSGSFQR